MTELGLIVGISLVGLAFAGFLSRWILSRPIGDAEMNHVSARIRKTAENFIRRQSATIMALSAAFGGAIFLGYGLRESRADPVGGLELGVWATVSFLIGATLALAVGQVAVWTSTRTNVRAANGARRSVDHALQIALRGGAVLGLFVIASSTLALAVLFTAVMLIKGARTPEAIALVPFIPALLGGYALGASFAALLSQVAASTYSKGADIGADVGGRELDLAQDDAHNPATTADLAGDNIGDCSARGVAMFQAAAAENIGTMLIAAALFRHNEDLPSALAITLFPMVTRAFGVLGAMFGVMVVRTDDREDPLNALTRGLLVTVVLHAVGLVGAAKWLLGAHWLKIGLCGVIGAVSGLGLYFVCLYFTEVRFRPVRDLAEASRAGPTLTVLSGLSAGLDAAMAQLAVVALPAAGAYALGQSTGLASGGTFGLAVAALGLLGSAAYVLSMSAFGPIVDNAGGIVEMTLGRDRPEIRGRTLLLDGVGSTVKTLGRSYATASSAFTAVILVLAFFEEVARRASALELTSQVRFSGQYVYWGAILGVGLLCWFAARSLQGVTRSARRVIDEIRRQRRDNPPRPDRGSALEREASAGARDEADGRSRDAEADVFAELLTKFALRHMVWPCLVVSFVPVLYGLALRITKTEDNPFIATDSVAALVMAATVAGVFGALLSGIAGGAWDNAKKYILTGAHGGRTLVDESGERAENPTYYAAVVGDTVGDPLKDATGPAMLVLVKMLPVTILVFLPFFI